MTLSRPAALVLTLLVASPGPARAADEDPAPAARVRDILKANCHRCHGQDGSLEGGFNYVLDLNKLVARKKILPGDADRSPLFRRMHSGAMPPPDGQPRPSDADIELVRRWIDSGARGIAAPPERTFVTRSDVYRVILADLEKMDRRERRFQRYFTLTHFFNAGYGDDEIQTYRNALAKLVNSLSWHPKVRVPVAVDEHATVLRIDLRWYLWDAVLWNRILEFYPYGILDDSATGRAVSVATASRIPVLRADWFVANASRPPLYQEVLQLPATLPELERELRIDAAVNILQDRVLRAGFNGSGIARNNRILERHDSVHGYYWRSYDFEDVPENLVERGTLLPDQRNIFAYPLGPGNVRAENTFRHAGGEVIFSLPNGLQGYMLVNAVGNRIDKAPVNIVSDPKRPDKAVETGVSCMGCHVQGIIPKADQVRDHLTKNPGAFPEAEAEIIRALYAPKEETLKRMQEDAEQFQQALAETGNTVSKFEPVITMTLRYEGDLDAVLAASEVGMPVEEFKAGIARSELLKRNLGALLVPGGTVHRPVWVQALGDVVRELGLGNLFLGNPAQGTLPDNTGDLDPLESAAGEANDVAFSADGRLAVIASADRSVRLYEVEGRRDLRRFIGHSASVWSVAFSPDEKRALSGSMDTTVRLWDVATGREIRQLNDHRSVVTALAFTPDGKRAVSGGFDGRVILWDLETGKEIFRIADRLKYVHAVAVSPNAQFALVAGDKRLMLVELESGKIHRWLDGHADAVTCVAFSPDGKLAVSGSDDRTVCVWDLASGELVKRLTGHEGHVKSVALNQGGKWVLSAGTDRTVRLWDAATGVELGLFRKHAAPVARAAFTASGRQTVSGDRAAAVQIWNLEKFLAAAKPQPEPEPGPRPGQLISEGQPKPGQPDPEPGPRPEPKPQEEPSSPAPRQGGEKGQPGEQPAGPDRPTPEREVTAPDAAIAVGGTLGELILSPDRKWLFTINRSEGIVLKLDTEKRRVAKKVRPRGDPVALALTPDGTALYAVGIPEKGALAKGGSLWKIDPAALKVVHTWSLGTEPFDVAAADDGRVYVSAAASGWTGLGVLDTKADENSGWQGFWGGSFLGLTPDQRRLVVATAAERPGKLDLLPLPSDGTRRPVNVGTAGSGEYPLAGPFAVTTDGKHLIARTGTVLRLDPGNGSDLQPAAKLPPAVALDADGGSVAVLTAADGLKLYSAADFRLLQSLRLPVTAYQIALDEKARRVYLAVIDPKTLAANPRARGFGDVWVIELKERVASR